MSNASTLRGLTTVMLQTSDLAAARQWYSEFLGVEPYFQRAEYIEFRLGDYQHELGILDRKYLPDLGGGASGVSAPSGAIVYWHVDDIQATFERALELGAKPYQPPRQFGEGFIGASVIDPFGNILGLMYNSHYLEILASKTKA